MCLQKLISLIPFYKKEKPVEEKAWEYDCLGYQQFADKFNSVIKTVNNSFTIMSLEGYSGWGQTFFLKEWVKALKQQNEVAAYYDAWDISALDKPLASFLHFLFETLFTSYKIKRSIINQFLNMDQELFSLNTLEKIISKSPLSMFSVLLNTTKEADRKDISYILKELNVIKRRKENIQDFRKQLAKIVDKIRNGKNIFIMVDNLNMCRSEFIVDFLESIKYILNIEGLVFIITVSKDINNVQNAINKILGANFGIKSFMDFTLHLPKQPIYRFIKKLFRDVKLTKKNKELIVNSFIFYAINFSLSLKAIEYCVKKIQLIHEKEKLLYPNLLSFLVILQFINNDMYEELTIPSQNKILQQIENSLIPNYQDSKEWKNLKNSLETALQNNELQVIRRILA
ncbi:NTPase [Wolbachia pipientis]|uniref:NTPase n=1 Tax=Wolbachia pipientis TaxID=955 RepID=A0A1E7QL39_WOLPI|nr:P-loop NTPase fold protein [Wolbachia pipientis]OEY86929.1 NTPase [Wolbachia pipientis]